MALSPPSVFDRVAVGSLVGVGSTTGVAVASEALSDLLAVGSMIGVAEGSGWGVDVGSTGIGVDVGRTSWVGCCVTMI